MNLNAIKSNCHGGKRATVYCTVNGEQWISNGFGEWLVEGVRIEGEESLMSLWNLSEKAKLKAVFLFEQVQDARFSALPMDDEEELTELGQIAVGDNDRYICLKTRLDGLLFIDAALVKPVCGPWAPPGNPPPPLMVVVMVPSLRRKSWAVELVARMPAMF